MDKNYNHVENEERIYKLWEKSGAFSPSKKGKPVTIIMPPPNANDPLHIGHARFVAIEDILIRYHRMKGDSTLWLPGSDHAGIETQYVFEKKLGKDGKSRFDFDRDTFYKMIWDYVQKNTGTMKSQLKKLGASCDWVRFKFTLDPKIIAVVYKTFKKLYDDGLIYRGERIVNYCPRCGTAYSQLEVNSEERDDKLYYLDYGAVTVATTRPETIFADVAVAVNPKDKRYSKLIGINAQLPLINRGIPIIADNLVEMGLGTGALKITPGHDSVDFEIGQKHHLSSVNVIDDKGKMINTPEKYIGMKALVAREEVIRDLENAGKLIKTETIKHVVGLCYRDKGLLEPKISKQWFVKVGPLAKRALEAIKNREVRFSAKKYEKIAVHWLKNLKDWNISRQIVWGIRIPAWRCEKCMEWTIAEGETPIKCSRCKEVVLTQDTDTFDTWFSSGQWPFATLQTTKGGDFKRFYPTSVMETAYDILPFWVIRMIMLGLYVTGEVPFREVVIHGLVRDKEGNKISKSKGNIIDPIEMTEKYGADALRMAMIWGALVENDIALSEDNVKGQGNFANKIWNIARFVLANKTDDNPTSLKLRGANADDRWILKELKDTTKKVTKALDKYRLNEAAEEIYDFVWHKFADVYIEKCKSRREEAQPVLTKVLDSSLRLLHPFMPFVTEAIWSELKNLRKYPNQLLITSSWPKT
ncbi:MAG: valine--tRNA ligase [bacterium]